MDNIQLVTTALEYYDNNSEKYNKLFHKISYIKFKEAENELEHNSIIFFDSNKKELFSSRYEIIGIYSTGSNTWSWAWTISTFKKNNTNIVRKILNYGLLLDPSSRYLKTELITSRFRVADLIQLDIHIGIASYLSKTPLIYEYVNYPEAKPDEDGYVLIKKFNRYGRDSKDRKDNQDLVYFMFLLDFEKIIKQKDKVIESEQDC